MSASDSLDSAWVWHLICREEWGGLGIVVVVAVVVLVVTHELLALAELGPVESGRAVMLQKHVIIIGFNICCLLLSSEKWHLNLLVCALGHLLAISTRFQAKKRGGISPEALLNLKCFSIPVIWSRFLASRACNLEMLWCIEAERVESLRCGIICRCSGLVNGNFWFGLRL